MFGKYRILSTLGTGSSSTVYLAEHLKLEIYRAIKCIPKDNALISSLALQNGYSTEAFLLKALNHPGIPHIYDIEEDDSFLYIIEDFISGDSLDIFLSHQEHISQQLIIYFAIQICDILDYLHHVLPYPILYQDLKPEHIIVCGNQIKLVDFGIATYFTNSGNQFQLYGTSEFAAPEAISGEPVTPACDIYSLGKILGYMTDTAKIPCSASLLTIIQKASAKPSNLRYETAADLKEALLALWTDIQPQMPHLIKTIGVVGSRVGAGSTHIALSFATTLNSMGISAVYVAANAPKEFFSIQKYHKHLKEQNGIYRCRHFSAVPAYGEAIADPIDETSLRIKDYGALSPQEINSLQTHDILVAILSGSDWDLSETLYFCKQLASDIPIVYLCNYGNRRAAGQLAKFLQKKIFCFPLDADAYHITPEKQHLVASICKQKGGNPSFLAMIKERLPLLSQ